MGYSINVAINKGENENLKAVASLTIDKSFKVSNIAIMEGKHGLFVAMPRFKGKNQDGSDKYTEICHPITAEFRKELYGSILATYEDAAKSEEKFAKFVSPDIKEEPDIKVNTRAVQKEGTSLKGFAGIVFNDNFVVNNLPIREGNQKNGEKKMFLSMPSYISKKTNDYKDVVYPTSKDFAQKLSAKAVEALQESLKKEGFSKEEENPFENGTFDNRALKEMLEEKSMREQVVERYIEAVDERKAGKIVITADELKTSNEAKVAREASEPQREQQKKNIGQER